MRKKVIVLQKDLRDCGVCCIQSILKHYNGFLSLEQIRIDTHTNQRGTSAYHIIEAMKRYGFDAYGTKIVKEKIKECNLVLPAIVHVILEGGMSHFMVLYEIRHESVLLMDPAKGKIVMAMEDFFWIWSEVTLIVYPKEKIIEWKKTHYLKNSWDLFVKQEKSLCFPIFLMSIISLIMGIASSFYFKLGINAVELQESKTYFLFLMIVFFGLQVAQLILNSQKNVFLNYWNKNINVKNVFSFLNHLFFLPYSNFKSRNSGDYLTRLWETLEIKNLFTDLFLNTLLSIILIFISSFVLFFVNKKLLEILLFISVFYIFFYLLINKNFLHNIKEHNQLQQQFNTNVIELFEVYDTIKNLNLEQIQLEKMEPKIIRFMKSDTKLMEKMRYNEQTKNFLKEGLYFVITTIGLISIGKNDLSIVAFILFQSVYSYYQNGMDLLLFNVPKWKEFKNLLTKSSELLQIEEEIYQDNIENLYQKNIEIRNLDFSYNDYNLVLKNLNLEIVAGSHIVLKGKSGCGKSTLCKLLCRYFTTQSGEIKIGDKNILDYSLSTIRKEVAYLSQKENLITGSIRENILFGRLVSEEKYHQVCEICCMEDIVKKRPMRYETTVNPFSNSLSGGERQRIYLARMLLSNASIFLLDEPLSEVDDGLEKKIIKAMRHFLKDKTIIYITHKNQKGLFDEIIKIREPSETVYQR